MTTIASPHVVLEWRARIVAEYTSAAITQHLVLWMIQAGAPPDLIEQGLAIVGDELAHSGLSHEVYVAAGGTDPPAIDPATLGLIRNETDLLHDVLAVIVRVFCLGETVAVPLFVHLRSHCTIAVARAALDRIVRDEARHRTFGWDALDWLQCSPIAAHVVASAERGLPGWLAALQRSYGADNAAVIADDPLGDDARAWGLAPAREYADILARTIDAEFRPRFAARGITLP